MFLLIKCLLAGLSVIVLIFACFIFNFQIVLAQDSNNQQETTTEDILGSINVDLPLAELTCRASGSLSELFPRQTKLKSGGNAFFLDKASKEIALFEKAQVINKITTDSKTTIDIFIKVPNVSRDNLVDLLLKKKLIVSRDARVVFAVRIFNGDEKEVFVYGGKDEEGNFLPSTLFTQVRKLSTITVGEKKFFTAFGFIKIRLPEPPKRINSDGKLIDVFSKSPGTFVCSCKGCPIHDFDLSDLKDAFDGGLVEDITNEAVGGLTP